MYAGAFYEANTVGVTFPQLLVDDAGNPTGLALKVQGCGNDDPATLEGYFDGFTPISQLRALGLTLSIVRDVEVLGDVLEVIDVEAGDEQERVPARFRPVTHQDLELEPIPGVTMPTPPEPGLLGAWTEARFSYSERLLLQRGHPSALALLSSCRAEGGTPAASRGRLRCSGVTPLRTRLRARRPLEAGRSLSVSCNKPCDVVAKAVARGSRLAR